jgi:hypothetical protein
MSLKANQIDTIATEGGIDADDTEFTLTAGAFDNKTTGDKVPLIIDYDNSSKLEVVTAYINGTAVSGMTRGEDGTAATTHSQGANVCIGSVPETWKYWMRNDYGIMWTAHTPTFTGFSANPSGYTSQYKKIGDMVVWRYYGITHGTSNATTFTMTLPVAASSTGTAFLMCLVKDNGSWIAGTGAIANSATTIAMGVGATTGGFTASGGKDAAFVIIYGV